MLLSSSSSIVLFFDLTLEGSLPIVTRCRLLVPVGLDDFFVGALPAKSLMKLYTLGKHAQITYKTASAAVHTHALVISSYKLLALSIVPDRYCPGVLTGNVIHVQSREIVEPHGARNDGTVDQNYISCVSLDRLREI